MAYSFLYEGGESISLEEYVQIIVDEFDVYDQASLVESCPYLYKLSNNPRLFDSIIESGLKDMYSNLGMQEDNKYFESSFMLTPLDSSNFFIRANIWKKPKSILGSYDIQNRLYSYGFAHDHNFDFVTAGYFGPGYKTSIFEYDAGKIEGKIGELVDLHFLEETSLPIGKVMMYRKSADIHTQYPPEATSISLNLMVRPPVNEIKQQYAFDVENGIISGLVAGPASFRVSLLELAGELGDSNIVEPLIGIASRHPNVHTRAAAIKSIIRIVPEEKDRIRSMIQPDGN